MKKSAVVSKKVGTRFDRRRARTREAIIQAGETLLSRRPIEGVSVDDIAEAADVAKGSFYNHFSDKAALATEIAESIRRSVAEAIAANIASERDPAMAMAIGGCTVLLYGLKHRERAGALTRLMPGMTALDAPLNIPAEKIIKAGLAQGVFSEVTVEEGLLLCIGTCMLMLHHALDQKDTSFDQASYAVAMIGGLLRALGVNFKRARNTANLAVKNMLGGKGVEKT